jgi:acyl carrier protein
MKSDSYGEVLTDLVNILEEMTEDWDMEFEGGIGADTKLIEELSFESIEVVQLMVLIEERFRLANFNSEEILMEDDRYVEELPVGRIARYVADRVAI